MLGSRRTLSSNWFIFSMLNISFIFSLTEWGEISTKCNECRRVPSKASLHRESTSWLEFLGMSLVHKFFIPLISSRAILMFVSSITPLWSHIYPWSDWSLTRSHILVWVTLTSLFSSWRSVIRASYSTSWFVTCNVRMIWYFRGSPIGGIRDPSIPWFVFGGWFICMEFQRSCFVP